MAATCCRCCGKAPDRAANESHSDTTPGSAAPRTPGVRRCARVLLRELERTGGRAHGNPRPFRPGQSLALGTRRAARAALSDTPATGQTRTCCRRRDLRCGGGHPPPLTYFLAVGGRSPDRRNVPDAVDFRPGFAPPLRAEWNFPSALPKHLLL